MIAAENNDTLRTFSEGLGNFLLKVLNYVLYLSDEKPIDFDAFFGQKDDPSTVEENANSTEKTETATEAEPIVEEEKVIEIE